MDELEHALERVDVAREYGEYIPGEGEAPYPEEDEEEQFNSVLDSIEGMVKRKQEELGEVPE